MSERVGPFQLGPPQPHWGSGWFSASPSSLEDDDLPRVVMLHVSSPGEAFALALEGAWRGKHPHPSLPRLLRRGDDAGRTWLAFERTVAVPLDLLLDASLPVEIALAWTSALVGVMRHHAAHPPPNAPVDAEGEPVREALRPSFADLLVSDAGALVVVTAPAAGRLQQRPGLMVQPRRDRELLAPELVAGERFDAERVDIFVAGALLRALLGGAGGMEEREDVPSHIEAIVRRATAHSDERFESLDELAAVVDRAVREHAPLEADERAAFVKERIAIDLERAARDLGR